MKIFLYIVIFLFSAAFMELFAWFMHKYVMHMLLWVFHEDHHRPHKGWFKKNDIFVVFFASIAIGLIMGGYFVNNYYAIFSGFGVTFYGIGYFLFHDVMFLIQSPTIRCILFTKAVLPEPIFHHRNLPFKVNIASTPLL